MRPSVTRKSYSPVRWGQAMTPGQSQRRCHGGQPDDGLGLSRIGEVFRRIVSGDIAGGSPTPPPAPCLQHNLVAVLESA